MQRKIILGNMLVVLLLMIGCGQSETINSTNADNTNKAMSNSSNSLPTPGPSSTVASSSNASSTNAALPSGTPAKGNKGSHDELGNDAQRENVNDRPPAQTNANSNPQRPPRIGEPKPPQREKP